MINIHVDVDNLWSYEKEFGVPRSGADDLMYTQALPDMLKIFQEYRIKATFFIIGRDLEHLESCRKFCADAIAQGHELANHTYSHRTDFYRLSYREKELEIRRCHELLTSIAGAKVVGFRSPGYYLDSDIIEILSRLGYRYDTSVLPGPFNQLMKVFIRLKGDQSLDKMFGRKRYLFASQNLSRIRSFFEVPISCFPFLRLPVHSTMVYLLGKTYFNWAAKLIALFQSRVVYVFHSVDALNYPLQGGLQGKLPALKYSYAERLDLIRHILGRFKGMKCETTAAMVGGLDIARVPVSRLF